MSLEKLSCGLESGYGRKDIAGDPLPLLALTLVHHDTGDLIQLVFLLLIGVPAMDNKLP